MRAQWKEHKGLDVWELVSPHTGPTLILIGQIHGNEPAGWRVIQRLLTMKKELAESMRKGRVILIRGNREAARAKKRYTSNGVDLNRVWLTAAEEKKYPIKRTAYEYKRRAQLLPFLQADAHTVSLDIHSSSSPSEPFFVLPLINKTYTSWIKLLGVTHATIGWQNHFSGGHATLEWIYRHKGVGIGLECGEHSNPQTTESAWRAATGLLSAVCECFPAHRAAAFQVYKISKTIPYEEQFRWTKKHLRAPVRLKKGECFGASMRGKLTAPYDSYIFLPNAHPEPQNPDIGYLAKKI